MNIQRHIIHGILETGDIAIVLPVGKFMTEYCFDDVDKNAWKYLKSVFDKTGEIPSTELFRGSFPEVSYPFDESADNLAVLVDKAGRDIQRMEYADRIGKAVDFAEREQFDKIPSLFASDVISDSSLDLEFYRFSDLDEDTELFRIPNLLHTEGSVIFSAYAKTGKTLTLLDLGKALTTHDDFLGTFPCQTVSGSVALLDFEMPGNLLRQYAADVGIDLESGKIRVKPMRGTGSQFNVTDPARRKMWAEKLRELDTEVLIIDPIRPLASAIGLDLDNGNDAAVFTNAIAELCHDAGIDSYVLAHHTGHADKERSRGSSVLMDFPDAIWNMSRTSDDIRTFKATGRMISASGTVTMGDDKKLVFKDARESESSMPLILEVLGESGELSINALHKKLKDANYRGNREKLTSEIERARKLDAVNIRETANAKYVSLAA